MFWKSLNCAILYSLCTTVVVVDAFSTKHPIHSRIIGTYTTNNNNNDVTKKKKNCVKTWMQPQQEEEMSSSSMNTRRSVLQKALVATTTTMVGVFSPLSEESSSSNAAVGSLPEFADTNAILQGLTVDVADPSQQTSMIEFLRDGFNFKILRRRQVGSITDTWMGFGPEQLNIPSDFEIPVSSFANYGGHASIHIRYDSKTTDVFYNKGELAPGDNIAFLQVAVPDYRISQMVKAGGNIIDAFGYVNVVSPSGLPIRGIIGISPDPIMFVAINCLDMKQSKAFYQQLGFFEQEYPYSRPSKGTGQFEPPQPKGSVYLAPSPNSMGVLLLPITERKKKSLKPNPALRSLNIVYTPAAAAADDGPGESPSSLLELVDPSFVPYSFQGVTSFENEEKNTRVPMDTPTE